MRGLDLDSGRWVSLDGGARVTGGRGPVAGWRERPASELVVPPGLQSTAADEALWASMRPGETVGELVDRLRIEMALARGEKSEVFASSCPACEGVREAMGDAVGDACEAVMCADTPCYPAEVCATLVGAALLAAAAGILDPIAFAFAGLLAAVAAICYLTECPSADADTEAGDSYVDYHLTDLDQPLVLLDCFEKCEFPCSDGAPTIIAKRPSETENAHETGSAADTDHEDCATLAIFDGERILHRDVARGALTSGFSPSDWLAARTPTAWLRAPSHLRESWPEFKFDAPGVRWVYFQAPTKSGADVELRDCDRPRALTHAQPAYNEPSYLVMGLRPYVAYALLRSDGGHLETGTDCCDAMYRIRFWVGVTNHFSLFLDPTAAAEEAGLDTVDWPPPLWTTNDLPAQLWAPGTRNPVYARGRLVEWWMAYVSQFTASLTWHDDLLGQTWGQSRTFYCDPQDGPDGLTYGGVYANAGGEPQPLCFSAPAVANDASATQATAMLGMIGWGDVCVAVGANETLSDAKIHEGFKKLFGQHVKARFKVDYWSGFDREGNGEAIDAAAPHSLSLDFCLHARDAVPLWQLRIELDEHRRDDAGKWLFREWDVAAMEAHYASALPDGANPANRCDCPES